MKAFLTAVVLTCAMAGCSDNPAEPVVETASAAIVLEGVVLGNDVPLPGATVSAYLGKTKPDHPGGCDGGSWIVQGAWSLTADEEGEITADLIDRGEEGPVGTVALDGCLLLFTSMPGAPDVSSAMHVPVQAIWGQADTLSVILDITHLM